MCFGLETLAAIGIGVSAVGGAMSAVQQSMALQAQAEMHRRQADMEREKGVFDANQQTKAVRRTIGEQVASFAANGVDVSSGSPLQVVTDTGTEGALDVAATRFGARVRSDNEMYQSKVASQQAGFAMAAAPINFLTPILKGAPTIKSAFG